MGTVGEFIGYAQFDLLGSKTQARCQQFANSISNGTELYANNQLR